MIMGTVFHPKAGPQCHKSFLTLPIIAVLGTGSNRGLGAALSPWEGAWLAAEPPAKTGVIAIGLESIECIVENGENKTRKRGDA